MSYWDFEYCFYNCMHYFTTGARLLDIKEDLVRMFDEVINIASTNYDGKDKARLTIAHSEMPEEIFVHMRDVSNLTGRTVMERFEKVLNSHQDMTVDESFEISVGLMRLFKGGSPTKRSGRTLPLFPHLNKTLYSSIVNKKAIVEIICEDNEFICAAKSIVVCMAKLENMRRNDFLNLIRKNRQCSNGPQTLKTKALELQERAGLPTDEPLTISELAAFESVLKVKIAVIQFADESNTPVVSEVSGSEYDNVIFLYHTDDHFHAVVNHRAMFPKSNLCMQCFEV